MATALFHGGPLDGLRRDIPEHGPAWIRYWEQQDEFPFEVKIHWYCIKKGTKRTYTYAGEGNVPCQDD